MTRLDDGETALLETLGAGQALGELLGAEQRNAARTLFWMIARGWVVTATGPSARARRNLTV